MKILDTTFLVDCVRRSGIAKKKLEEIETELLIVSEISVIELYAGLQGKTIPESERESVEAILSRVNIIKVDEYVRYKVAEVLAYLKKKGKTISAFDTIIAGTALVYGATILTRDNHFDNVRDCFRADVEKYALPVKATQNS